MKQPHLGCTRASPPGGQCEAMPTFTPLSFCSGVLDGGIGVRFPAGLKTLGAVGLRKGACFGMPLSGAAVEGAGGEGSGASGQGLCLPRDPIFLAQPEPQILGAGTHPTPGLTCRVHLAQQPSALGMERDPRAPLQLLRGLCGWWGGVSQVSACPCLPHHKCPRGAPAA